MADCPYARCIQERRHIRRELLRWTKNMVFVVGLERVAEELMGRRRWKQYQDTLYSSTRSESANQPHHRLYPVLSTTCNLGTGSISQVVGHCHPSTGVVGQHTNQSATTPTTPPLTSVTTASEPTIINKHQSSNLTNHKGINDNDQSCLKSVAEIKVEAANEENGAARLELLQHGEVLTTSVRQRLKQRKGDEEDEETNYENDHESHEKRLKLDEEAVERTAVISPLRESDNCIKDEAIDTEERTKGRLSGVSTEPLQVTAGLLRVKKEEELQELPKKVNCGSETRGIVSTDSEINRSSAISDKQQEATSECATLPFIVNRRASPPPEDWKPLDKCYFCLDGKLPHDDQPPLSPQSESSSSSRSAESPMSVQVDPMAASVVAAALSGTYPTLLPQWCLPPRETPLIGIQSHQETGHLADQPLDLSAKPKNSQDNNIPMLEQQKIPLRMPAGIDPKSIFATSYRAKPRLTGPVGVGGVPVVGGGRRTYTEEELQAALRDIQSGKLGTRRAAVIYGIPRSTLRNKVYKLAMERERDASLSSTLSHTHESGAPASTITTTTTTTITSAITTTTTTTTTTPNMTQNATATTPPSQVDEADDKELSGAEEEKEVEKALLKPLLSLEDLVRFSALEGGGGDSLRTLLQRGQETGTEWPGFEHANIGPYIQKMLAAAAPFKGLDSQDYRIPEVMRRLMSEDKRLNKDVNGDQHHHSQLHHHHHHHLQSSQQQLAQQTQQQVSQQQRVPMTNDDFNPNIEEEASDSAQGRAILKIPSYKPASTPGSSKNNGEPNSTAFAQSFAVASNVAGSPGLMERASPAFSGASSPTNSLVGKAVGVSFRDVIAKSISSKFQEGQTGLPGQATIPGQSPASMSSDTNPFKRGRYTPPQSSQSQQQQQQQQTKAQALDKSKPGSGGKGTRPKRGKYRNYDRDSLVEAVRAVQRGEMSVHRAGSYYGVPHSTLEYKVKERHLMRPRKRDQKPTEDKSKESAVSGATMRPSIQEKKPPLKTQKAFTPNPGGIPGPNGLKMPPFLEGMTHLPFPHPFNFWGPTPFMPSPFIAGAPNVPPMLSEQYFATQRMRGLQEQQRSAIVQQQQQQQQRDRDNIGSGAEPGTSNSRGSSIVKTTREIAESLYDGSGANGSFLDNLIRSSLETGIPRDRVMADGRSQQSTNSGEHQSETMGSKALIDQLCRNPRRTPLPRIIHDSSEDESFRGPSTRSLPERPERAPTVDLSPSPTDRTDRTDRTARADEQSSDRLTSPPTPLSIQRTGSRDEDTRDCKIDRDSRDREIHNGGQDDRDSRKTISLPQQLNHYPDIHNLYSVSNDKKSACDSKLLVDHSSQKTQQQQQQPQLVVQLQRGYTGSTARSTELNQQNNSQQTSQPVQEPRNAVLTMEDSVEQ